MRTSLRFALALALPPLTLDAAYAQAAPSKETIEVIIVTAQKRDEQIDDVPISISVVSGEALKAASAKNLTELQGVVPGIYFSGNGGYGGAPIAVRGTSGANTSLLDEPVAVYVDGVYLNGGGFPSSILVDIDGIEILRGPQGTLQGRNATAGAVLVRTADPDSELGGYARASVADPTEYRFEGALTGPITDTLSARLSAGYLDEEGWAKNTFDGSRLGSNESATARLIMLWEPNDRARVRLAATYYEQEAEPALARWAQTIFNPAPGPLVTIPTPTVPLTPAEQDRIRDEDEFALNRPNDSRSENVSSSLQASYAFDKVELFSVTGASRGYNDGHSDSDGLARTDREGFNDGKFTGSGFSQELRLQSIGDGPFSWILGGYYSRALQDMFFRIYNFGYTLPDRRYTTFISDQETKSLAGFADVTYRLNDAWAITGGVRYTEESKTFTHQRIARFFDTNLPSAPVAVFTPPEKTWDDTSFRGMVSFTPTSDLLFYASYSKGFKSGGFNAFGTEPAFDPELLYSAEIGAKATLLDGRWFIATSVYSNDYEDLQIRAGVPSGGIAIANAADSSIEGFEFETTVRITDQLRVDANVAYTDARFDEFATARNILDLPTDATGNQLPRSPEWQYFLQGSYSADIGASWSTLWQLSWRWRDTVFFYHTDQTAPTLKGEPLGELGARISFTHSPSQTTLALFGTNLTNDRSLNGANINFSYPEASFNKPRSVGMQVEKRF